MENDPNLPPKDTLINLIQFYQRWPAKEGRLFLFGGGTPSDRLSALYMVADHWKVKVDKLDVVRLHDPNPIQVAEACRQDPLNSKYRVVIATEMVWEDPNDEGLESEVRAKRQKQFAALLNVTKKIPRDLVLIISTPHENPLTKNDLAQSIITKGYWVVLKRVDVETAAEMMRSMTGWEDEIIFEIIESVGTSIADLMTFLRIIRIVNKSPTEEQIRSYLDGYMKGTVFELTDSIVMKDTERALRLSKDEISMGQLIGSVDRKFTSLLQFMAEMRKGRSPKEAALFLRLPGFIVHGLYEASKRWSTSEILMMYPTLAEYSYIGDKPGSIDLMVGDLIGLED